MLSTKTKKPMRPMRPMLEIPEITEPAGLVGLRRYGEVQPLVLLPALQPKKGVGSTVVRTSDSHGLEGPGGVG
jgi:hypothetical protein